MGFLTYRRGELLGRGGFGSVFKVYRTTAVGEYPFAMKVFAPSAFVTNRERALERFRREMRILSGLQHRGIVNHLEGGIDQDGCPYILMPLIEGANIQQRFAGAEPRMVMGVFSEILLALDYAHNRNVIHRDLKPANILVRDSDCQPIILDFGCAYLLDDVDHQSLTTTLVGTLAYMPREVIADPKQRSTKQDIFACGCMLYQTLAGRLPDLDDYQPLRSFLPDVDGIDDIVRAAIAPEGKRLSSASEFRERIDTLQRN